MATAATSQSHNIGGCSNSNCLGVETDCITLTRMVLHSHANVGIIMLLLLNLKCFIEGTALE